MQSALSNIDRAEHISSNRTVVSIRRLLSRAASAEQMRKVANKGWRLLGGRRRAADEEQQAKSGRRMAAGKERLAKDSRRTAADGVAGEERQAKIGRRRAAADIVGNGYREDGERGGPSGRPAFV